MKVSRRIVNDQPGHFAANSEAGHSCPLWNLINKVRNE